MAVSKPAAHAKPTASAHPAHPAGKRGASVEILSLEDLPGFLRKHGLRVVGMYWPAGEAIPEFIWEPAGPDRPALDENPSHRRPQRPGVSGGSS